MNGKPFISLSAMALILTLFLSAAVAQQEQSQSAAQKSVSKSQLFPEVKDSSLRLSVKGTKVRAINRVAPKFPPSCRCQGTIIVAVLVNPEGKVEKAQTVSGHPLLQATSAKAAKEWLFKPLVRGDKPIAFVGLLVFTFKSYGEVSF